MNDGQKQQHPKGFAGGLWAVSRCSTFAVPLVLAALLYLLTIVVLKWDFLPSLELYPMDTRWPVCSSVDKLDELKSSQEMGNSLGRDLEQLKYFYTGQAVSPKRMDFNPAPKVLIWVLGQFLDAVPAYNLASLLVWLLNGLMICALVLYLTRVRSAGVLAGFLFCFSPFFFSVQHCRSLDYGMFFLVPAALLLLALVRDRRGWIWVVGFGVVLALLVLSQQYYVLGLGLLLLPWLVLLLIAPGEGSSRRRAVLRLLVAGLCGLLLAGPWLVFEWEMLQIQQSMMEARDANLGRSFFRALSPETDLGLAWTCLTAALAAVGLVLGARARLGERVVFAVMAALLLGAQHYISENAYDVALAMQQTVLWRVRACRLAGTLVVCLGAVLAGLGWAAAITRLRWWWARALLGLVLCAACVLFLREDLRWWEQLRLHLPQTQFPRQVVDRVRGLAPDPRIYAISLTPRLNLASYAGTYLEIMAEASRGPGEMERHLQQSVRRRLKIRLPEQRGGPASEQQLSAGELQRRCNVVVVWGGHQLGGPRPPPPAKPAPLVPLQRQDVARALSASGFATVLYHAHGWTIAHNSTCRQQLRHHRGAP